jgi:lysophospholipid acyltransferase (LPLAT)-like uncharacterized protein
MNAPALAWGRMIAHYGRWMIRSGQVSFEGELPSGGYVAASWHSMNLMVMAAHAELKPHPYRAFVPPGMLGTVMRGALGVYGMEAVALPRDKTGNPAAGLKEMARALKDGWAVGIALDGPHGAARVLRPGALWLARLSGTPLVVIGAAAKPAFRAPRWDHQLIPLPYARIALAYGEPIVIPKGDDIGPELCARVTQALAAAEKRAWALVESAPPSST